MHLCSPEQPPPPKWVPTHQDEGTLCVSAVTLDSEDTLVTVQHVARLADTAFLAGGGDFRADIFAEAFWVGAGRQAGGKAVGEEAVGGALQSCGVGGERLVAMNRRDLVSQMLLKKKKSRAGQINSRASCPILSLIQQTFMEGAGILSTEAQTRKTPTLSQCGNLLGDEH